MKLKADAKLLKIDIETAPHTAHVWSLFKQTVSLSQLQETGRVLCAAWQWGSGPIQFVSEFKDGREKMLVTLHELLTEADIVVTYNGKRFDIPTINKEFLELGFPPPAPYKQVDLYQVARSKFRFASNKMDHLAKQLGIKTKVRHSGHDLWVSCMANDPKAWSKMERYNRRDVLILNKLYERMLPWISGHPNVTLYDKATRTTHACPSCGSDRVHSRGTVKTKVQAYTRYSCTDCGSWSRSRLPEYHPKPALVACNA